MIWHSNNLINLWKRQVSIMVLQLFGLLSLIFRNSTCLIFSFCALDSNHLLQFPNLVASSFYLYGFDYAILNTCKSLKFFWYVDNHYSVSACFIISFWCPRCIYRDIQASSVLLDDKFEVHLGSLSKICIQQSEGSPSFFSRIFRSSK
jgi:hypothetical protein